MNLKTIFVLTLICTGIVAAEKLQVPSGSAVVATVNGDEIVTNEVAEFLQITKLVIGAVNFRKRRDEIENTAVQDLINWRLMVLEFEKRGGEVKPEYLNKLTRDLIAKQFQGNRDLFLKELKASNLNEDQVRAKLKGDLISNVFRAEIRQEGGVKNPIDPFEAWLESLRKKATITIAN